MGLYLDYNASAPILDASKDAIIESMKLIGNPSSIHTSGRKVKTVIEDARELVAGTIGASPQNIIFTSGASEANALAFKYAEKMQVITSAIEHESILEQKNKDLIIISVNNDGTVNMDHLEKSLSENMKSKLFVSVMAVNNETGIIQPIEKIAALCLKYNSIFHVDAVQAIGRIKISMSKMNIDLLTVSSHKIGGPKGIGCLAVNKTVYNNLSPIIYGGGQERGIRAGTEAVSQIAGFGVAAKYSRKFNLLKTKISRDALEENLLELIPGIIIIGKNIPRVANTTAIAFKNILAENIVIALDIEGYEVSSGSACSSGKISESHVLLAMGLDKSLVKGSIRISLCRALEKSEIVSFCNILYKIIQKLSKKR
mgnify:CR=1 FL=1